MAAVTSVTIWLATLVVLGNYIGSTCAVKSTGDVQLQDIKDFCTTDDFNATCPSADHMIVMTHARFGRMATSRCINTEGKSGCSSDVLSYFDDRCTGRQQCDVPVRDLLVHFRPCGDLLPYLQAAYTCVLVPYNKACRSSSSNTVTSPSAYLVSQAPDDRSTSYYPPQASPGSPECPWIVKVEPGRHLEFSLITLPKDQHSCMAEVLFQDQTSPSQRTVKLCPGSEFNRGATFFGINSSHVMVSMKRYQIPTTTNKPIVIHYTATGCPDVIGGRGLVARRTVDTLKIQCNTTGETWYLTCIGNGWLGDYGNCTEGGLGKAERNGPTDRTAYFKEGILLAVVIGMALGIVIGGSLLVLVLCCKRRHSKTWNRSRFFLVPSNDDAKTAENDAKAHDKSSTAPPPDACPCILKDSGLYGHNALSNYASTATLGAVHVVNTHPMRGHNSPYEGTFYRPLDMRGLTANDDDVRHNRENACVMCDSALMLDCSRQQRGLVADLNV